MFWRKHLIDDLPTSKTQGVFIGLVELKGTAESEKPINSFLSETKCVYYKWQIDEHWSRTVVETYTDAQGHSQTRTRTESGWTKIAGGSDSIPFYLKDDTGIIRVLPKGASVDGAKVFNKTCGPSDKIYYEKGPPRELANSTHQRRFQETALPLHAILYVMGQARERSDVVAAEITEDKNAPAFIISTKTERQISSGYARWFWLLIILGLLFSIGGALAFDLINELDIDVSWKPYAVGISGFLFVLTIGWIWTVYNSLVGLRNRVGQAWSLIDVQLKRRHDLIPNLAETVKGYQFHEKETQKLMALLRQQIKATPPESDGPDYGGITPSLKVVLERYPKLKADTAFLKLQQALVDTEQRVALARDYFNDIATFYNNRLAIIPDSFIAILLRLKPRELLAASDFERAPVAVEFA